jgi:hypothetical protein
LLGAVVAALIDSDVASTVGVATAGVLLFLADQWYVYGARHLGLLNQQNRDHPR